jgi:serine/threonine-protein kinase
VTGGVRGPAAEPGGSERFRRADAVFDAALDLEPGERAAYLERACAGDGALREDVARLLRAHERSGDFLAGSAEQVAAPLLEAPGPSDQAGDEDGELRERLQCALGGAYRVEGRLARGGMAMVFLARDLRHGRTVAVKVLDPALGAALDADGGAERFLAEIRVTAGLHHPNLLPLFDSGSAEGLPYYVMPYVDGETLRQRLRRESPLPVGEAVRIALGVAGALEHAHAHGVVHRDLKPENVLLQAGQPVVADFGIALALSHAGGARATRPGFTLGTPQYMAPEQAEGGGAADPRSDVYSLGAVLYEMLTGDPPHAAGSAQAVLAKRRVERPTPARVLRPGVPEHVSRAVDRALERLPADRTATVRELADMLAGRRAEEPSAPTPRRWRRAGLAAGAALACAGALAFWALPRGDAPVQTTRFVVAPIPDAAIGRPPTITPDGGSLVYAGSAAAGRRLFVRPVGELTARPLAGTEGALSVFVSPDGRWAAFFTSDDRLRKVPVDGGPVTTLAGAFRYSAGSWAGGDRIVLSTEGQGGLTWIPADGGTQRRLTRLATARGETRHGAPLVLDDGRTVVFTAERHRNGPVPADGELAVATLDPDGAAPAPHTLLGVRARRAVAVVDGRLLYITPDGAALMAVRFDAARRRVEGAPTAVLEQPRGGIDAVALAQSGTLLYSLRSDANAPVRVDSAGGARPMFAGASGYFMNPRFSPDGRRLAIQGTSPRGTDVWIYDVASGTRAQLTTLGSAIGPTWTPDGERIVFLSTQGGRAALWAQPAGGSAPAERVVEGDGVFAADVAPDGREVVFQRQAGRSWGIWSAPMDGRGPPRPVVVEGFDALMPALSPDGRWLAYAANASGRHEVYVRPYPGPGAAVQVSEAGGTEPAWSRDGRRLFFRGDRRMHAAALATRPALAVTGRETLFTEAFDGDMPMPHRNYDVSPDGREFVMIAAAPDARPETVVVLGWLGELRARLAGAP